MHEGLINWTLAGNAFGIGVFSALSLILGAISARFWIPEDRTVAALMAFGGGALLAALTIDLVAPSLALGHFPHLSIGMFLGGGMFMLLNEAVNDYGGFLRKVSTTVYHLRREKHSQYKRILIDVGRIDLFRVLTDREYKALASYIRTRRCPKGATVYRQGDPGEALYILSSGEIQLLDPAEGMKPFHELRPGEAFGRMAFLTGAPNATVAVATKDCELWELPRDLFINLLANAPRLLQAVHKVLRGDEVIKYLCSRQGFTPEAAEDWVDHAAKNLVRTGDIPDAVEIEHNRHGFLSKHQEIRRCPLFRNLPDDELELLASQLIYKAHHEGQPFFYKGDFADRMYIVDQGEVKLIDPQHTLRAPTALGDGDAFGILSFLTGSRHTGSALPSRDTSVWVLRKSDLEEMLEICPILSERVRDYIGDHEVAEYLQSRHGFDPDKVARWMRQATRNIESGRSIPVASALAGIMEHHTGAALAIWLGIMLDGIPESLVIGAIMVHSSVSFSLIAGLFISNFPEALSSAVGMRQQGFSQARILLMWGSLVLMTGLGAALGSLFFAEAGHGAHTVIEGVAAGAMLTMIAQTMLPEAYLKGGTVVGLSTLAGFIAALFFKTLETGF